MSYVEKARALKESIDKNQTVADEVKKIGGIRHTEPEQSDKIGYDWIHYFVNDIKVHTEYVAQADPRGTEVNPIVWKPSMALIPNAYYTNDGVRKVWMGVAGVRADWDDENFIEF